VDGYINGIDVKYSVASPDFLAGPAKIHHLLLLWTGDHVAQCEVSKCIFCGKMPCHFCKITGEACARSHYYYGNYC
jgi:hypothetical protein